MDNYYPLRKESIKVAETKWGKCVVTLPIIKRGDTELMHVGAPQLNGFNCSIIYAYAFKTGITGMSTKPHVHDYDEAIYFIGSDPRNFSDLGAEVEFSIGPEGEEEKHIFTAPTAIVVPKGVPHCPIVTLKIEKPYLCMAVSLTGTR
jgi:hypothetical protein